ncbi:MAG: hypothetical protein MHM6MM_000275 [Cercozoa sp. M6MM]
MSTQQIDERALFEDVGARFKYLCDFVGFGKEDIKLIHGCAEYLGPLVPTVVDAVYDKLFSFSVTKEVFAKRNAGFQGKLDSAQALSVRSEQIVFRKGMLSKYLVTLVTQPYDSKMLAYLDWVGKIHTSKAGSKSIGVDMIHCNALMGYVQQILTNALFEAETFSLEKRQKAAAAFGKLLWIQNDLFLRHYLDEGPQAKERAQKRRLLQALATVGAAVAGASVAIAGMCLFKKKDPNN